MLNISKALVASGLVILTGPLSFIAQAQDYVDVEAERAAEAASSGSSVSTAPPATSSSSARPPQSDPYSVQPAKVYPATSYGTNRAPSAIATPPPPTPISGQSQGQNLGNLFYQIQQLQQEVMQLNGKVEEQANELRRLKEQSLERYVNLDKRLGSGGGSTPATGGAVAGGSTAGANAAIAGSQSSVAAQPGEADAYRAAYALVRSQEFDQAVQSFEQFLRNYPGGTYAPNAHYWLGELYLVIQPPNLESSRQSFTLLLSQYPNNSKAPDALFKLGKVQFMKGNREKAREYLDRVISQYGSTNSSAVPLAKNFIAENY